LEVPIKHGAHRALKPFAYDLCHQANRPSAKSSNIAPFLIIFDAFRSSDFKCFIISIEFGAVLLNTAYCGKEKRVHVLIGASALQVIRCIRSQGASAAQEWFPEVEPAAPAAFLPDEDQSTAENETDLSDIPASLFEEKLSDASFPFEAVIANRSVDCSYINGSELLADLRPLELGIFDEARKTYRDSLHTKLLRPDLPREALIGAGKHTCFASPELVVVQLASKLSIAQLTLLIMELSGFYTISPMKDGGSAYGIPPVTSVARIRALARRVRMMRGREVLRAALETALERSASPMESVLAIMLQLPIDSGGYGMGPVLVNPRIKTPDHAQAFASQHSYYPDIYLQSCFIDVEYESSEFHLDPITANWAPGELERWRAGAEHKAATDRIRTRELQALGVHVVPVTAYDMRSLSRLDNVAWAIACQMERLGEFDAASYLDALDARTARIARGKLLKELMHGHATAHIV
jgi:hypothetical protein